MKKLLTHSEVFGFLIKQGHKLTKNDWSNLNVEGSIDIILTQEEVSFINNHSKLSATMGNISCL